MAPRIPPPDLPDLHPVPVAQRRSTAVAVLDEYPPDVFEKPKSKAARRKCASARELFEAWVNLPLDAGGAGVGLATLPKLNTEYLSVLVYRYLEWLLGPVPADHPLLTYALDDDGVRRRQRKSGSRGKAEAYRPSTIDHHRYGVADALEAVVGSEIATAILADVWRRSPTSESTPLAKVRIDFTVEAVDAYVAALSTEVLTGNRQGLKPGPHATAFHKRQLAAFLTQLWGVMRIGELGRLYDANRRPLMKAGEVVGIEYRLNRTKPGPGRDVILPVIPGHQLCPVTAILDWHDAAEAAGYDREGLTLPLVVASPRACTTRKPDTSAEGDYFRELTIAAGLENLRTTSGMPAGDALTAHNKSEVTFGTHSLRRLLVSQAAAAGHDLAFMLNLGGGAWRDKESASTIHAYISATSDEAQKAVLEGED